MNIQLNINEQKIKGLEDDIFKALKISSEYLLTEANKTVPLDDGVLKASGKTSYDNSQMICNVSYDTPYALRLHEHPEYNFQGNGRGKWLELTLNEKKQEMARLIQQKIKASIDQGGGI